MATKLIHVELNTWSVHFVAVAYAGFHFGKRKARVGSKMKENLKKRGKGRPEIKTSLNSRVMPYCT